MPVIYYALRFLGAVLVIALFFVIFLFALMGLFVFTPIAIVAVVSVNYFPPVIFMTAAAYGIFSLPLDMKGFLKVFIALSVLHGIFYAGSYLFYNVNPFGFSHFILGNTKYFHTFFLPAVISCLCMLIAIEKLDMHALNKWITGEKKIFGKI